jgi:NDP-sugar pyrophosphorylase family protein
MLLLASCSNNSYFSKEGQTASAAGYSCPWGQGNITTQEYFNDVTINGNETITQTTVKGRVTVNGTATIENATLKKDLIVHGSATVKNSTIKNGAIVYGTITFDNVTTTNKVTVFGLLKAQKSTLHDVELYCSRGTIPLNYCSLSNITIKVDDRQHEAPVTIELLNTTVAGNITFSNGKGIVTLQGTSSIKGTMHGGTVSK